MAWDSRDDVEFLETVDKGDANWRGNIGVITTLFTKIKFSAATTLWMVVGPPVMYRFVIKEALDKNMNPENIYLSLERRMKCGIGKCGHCQINNKYCCVDGPVFTYAEIAPLEEAL
jgi:NAD(P)H-flavin reductase